MDFALILVVATAITGVIWLADALLFRGSRAARIARGEIANEPIIVEYARSFFPVLLLVVLLRSFLFEPFRIPSGSMMPTLLEGDFIFVNKFVYGLRLPVLNDKIVELGEPERGDVVVFRLPSDPSVNYIKRIVGLPGDVVSYDANRKQISINGEPVEIDRVGPYEDQFGIDLAVEVLGDKEHEVLWYQSGRRGIGGTWTVPENYYFAMGDNRDNSTDSRYESVGFIPEENLVGRAARIWMSWRAPSQGGPRWSRIGQGIE
ncbi:MAG: signal peptidase I [Gammaproteobacteria bacterium]|nr:signal peptidase I [Gammaproteobacteria bacterium]